jgi:NADH:ubiquinone oxidoreductase subunit C
MTAEETRLAIGGTWTERADGWWLTAPATSIQKFARILLNAEARFVTIVALSEPNNVLKLSWHWDIGGTLLSLVSFLNEGTPVPSIADIYPGADWAERETRDYFAVTFEGRKDTPTLMLRDSDTPGKFLRTSGDAQ